MDNLWIIYGYGWWLTYPSEKYESIGMIIPSIWKNKKNAANHQPVMDFSTPKTSWKPLETTVFTQILITVFSNLNQQNASNHWSSLARDEPELKLVIGLRTMLSFVEQQTKGDSSPWTLTGDIHPWFLHAKTNSLWNHYGVVDFIAQCQQQSTK